MATEVDIGGFDVFQALMIPLVIVVIDEGFDLRFEITWRDVIFQQDEVLQGLMAALDLALGRGR